MQRQKIIYFLGFSLALVTFSVYLPSLQNDFVNWDDHVYVFENSSIRSFDAAFFRWAFFGFHEGNWHPLTWISHALDYAIWGLNPLGHHLTNNILHAVNTFLVVLLVVRLLDHKPASLQANKLTSSHDSRFMLIAAATTGLLFGLHPIHVESVAWVSERKDLLCAFFFLLSMMVYVKYAGSITPSSPSYLKRGWQSRRRYLLALCFFILALLSKPMAVTLPFVLLILDWYPFRRIQSLKTFWTAFIEKLPFFVLALMSSVLTILAQKADIKSIEHTLLGSRVIVAAKSLIAYLVKMVLPLNLVPFYPYPENISLYSLEYIMPAVTVIAITVTCITLIRRQKLWISVWSYYVITLLPVLGIVKVGEQSMADRYTYLPSLGPFLVIGFITAKVYEKVSSLQRGRVMLRMASFSIAVTALVFMSYATIQQIGIWKNSIVLWNYVIDKEPSVPLAHHNLSEAYISKGQYDLAIEHALTALRLKPDDADVHCDLGVAYLSKGLFDMAIEQYLTALRLKPDLAVARYNLAYVYLSRGQFDRAMEQYQKVLRLKPNDPEVHNYLGNAYLSIGRYDLAIEHYQNALRQMPNLGEVHYNLGDAYFSVGQYDPAIEHYLEALRLVSNIARVHYKLGLSYLGKGSKDMARREFELELRTRPDDYEAQRALNSIISR